MSRNRPWTVMLLSTAAIFAGHAAMNTRGTVWEYERVSEELVNESLKMAYAEGKGASHSGGFMYRGNRPGHAYSSQYGLQYRAIAAIPFLATRHSISRFTFGFLSAVTLSLVVVAAYREFGVPAAALTAACLATAMPLAQFSMNLYWVMFLLFAPFAAACLFYPKFGAGRFTLFCVLIGVLLFAKSLCGYEMLSSILAGALVPLVYYETRNGASRGRIIVRALAVLVAGVIGFAAAISLHLYSLTNYLGSWEKCRDEVRHVILFRTVGDEGFQIRDFVKSLMVFFGYFIDEQQAYFIIAAALALYAWRRMIRIAGDLPVFRAEFNRTLGLLVLAFAASLSWNILAWGHMRAHIHVDYLTFYLPFNVVVMILCGFVVSRIQAIVGRDAHA